MARSKNMRAFLEVFRPREASQDSKKKSIFPWRQEKKDEEMKMGTNAADSPKPTAEGESSSTPIPEPPIFTPLRERKPSRGKVFTAESGNIVITLSNEGFAAAVIVFIVLLAGSFAFGNWLASRRTPTTKPPTPEPPKAPTVVIGPKKGYDTGIVRKDVARESTVAKAPSEAKPTPRPAPKPVPAAAPKPPEPSTPYWTLQVISGINPNKAEELKIVLEKQGYPNVVVKREGRYAAVRVGHFESKDAPEAIQFKKMISEMKFEGRLQFQGCYFVKVE